MINTASAVANNLPLIQVNNSSMEAESNLIRTILEFIGMPPYSEDKETLSENFRMLNRHESQFGQVFIECLLSYSEDKETLSENFRMLNRDEFQSVQEDITFLEANHKWFNKFQFDGIISQLTKLPGFYKCAARLDQLRTLDEFEEDEKPLSLESAKEFLLFVSEFKDLGPPILGLFSQGTLSVGWRIADNKHLLIEPLGENNIGFALIRPDLTSPDQKFRVNGRGSRQAVIETLRGHGVDKWINPA